MANSFRLSYIGIGVENIRFLTVERMRYINSSHIESSLK